MSKNGQPAIKYTADDIAMLEEMRETLSEVYSQAVRNYRKNSEDGNFATKAAQRSAIGTTALALMEATDRLRQAKPGQ